MAVAVLTLVRRGRLIADLAFGVFIAIVTLALVATVGFIVHGGRGLVVMSGSMSPTIETGDVAVTRTVEAQRVEEGDVVTFSDPTRKNELVTHRVVKIERRDGKLAFTTKGDANTGKEEWAIAPDGAVGEFVFRIPKAGYVMRWAGSGRTRMYTTIGMALGATVIALRKIWKT